MMTLYKYRNIGSRTEEILTKKEVWLARPSTLNDPLECRFEEFDHAILKKQEIETQQAQLSGFLWQAHLAHKNNEVFFNLRGRQIKGLINKIKNTKEFDRKYRIANSFLLAIGAAGFSNPKGHAESIGHQLSNVGVFSLSVDPANMLMWSHYGDSHKGIAIGFSVTTDSELADPKLCLPVTYSDSPLKFDFSKGYLAGVAYYLDENGKLKSQSYIPIEDRQLQLALFTKTTVWSYEIEWRFVKPKFGSYPIPAVISELIFGLNCTNDERRKYMELGKGHLDNNLIYKEVFIEKGSTGLQLREIRL